jgi:glycosyltransferase involved in cell wall biosynthesis
LRCLWLTLADPDPATNGQFLYSGVLIQALAAAGAELDVVGLIRPDGRRSNGMRDERIRWWLADDKERSPWAALFSILPHTAMRMRTVAMRRVLQQLLLHLEHDPWDAIVFDSLSPAWMLGPLLDRCSVVGCKPGLLYIAQNHEASLAPRVAATHPHWLKRQIYRVDALKVAWLERSLAVKCDLISANAPEDCDLFRAQWPYTRIELLLPAYIGHKVESRRITADMPRRVVLVGSLDWLPKRANIEEFLAVADPLFAQAGVELQVVGSADERFLTRLRRKTRATQFTGQVENVSSYLKDTRIGVVAERVGGGFKLKALDYVFHRVPIFALAGSAPGLPLHDGESIMLCQSQEELAHAILRVIDDVPHLNRMHEAAFSACRDMFDIQSRGRELFAWISSVSGLGPQPAIDMHGLVMPAKTALGETSFRTGHR